MSSLKGKIACSFTLDQLDSLRRMIKTSSMHIQGAIVSLDDTFAGRGKSWASGELIRQAWGLFYGITPVGESTFLTGEKTGGLSLLSRDGFGIATIILTYYIPLICSSDNVIVNIIHILLYTTILPMLWT